MPKPVVYIMCGLPFSGKTTLARALVARCGVTHLDLDIMAMAEGLFPEVGVSEEQWGKIFENAHHRSAELLKSGKSVVFDSVNFDRGVRDRIRTDAERVGCSARVIYLQLPLEEIERRRQANRSSCARPEVLESDWQEIVNGFEIPTEDEDVLLFDGTLAPEEWIKNLIEDGALISGGK